MTTAGSTSASQRGRHFVVVSGYYGFDNLGDEAILEELVSELKRLCAGDDIVVLSARPEITAARYSVRSIRRTDIKSLIQHLRRARLFVSGGGGLFQNTRTLGSILFYGLQLWLARVCGAMSVVYAQGIGPLNGPVAKSLTRSFFAICDGVAVRDDASAEFLRDWGVAAQRTADPVWCLTQSDLPGAVSAQLDELASKGPLIALSLRSSHNLKMHHLSTLADSLNQTLPSNAQVLLLPLQADQDIEPLQEFANRWSALGRHATMIDTSSFRLPSQWISLFSRCEFVVAMRLHALIMALKAGKAVIGLSYDPKVTLLLTDFEQPILILAKEVVEGSWSDLLKGAYEARSKLSQTAMRKAESAKNLACQNFKLLDRIFNMQSDS